MEYGNVRQSFMFAEIPPGPPPRREVMWWVKVVLLSAVLSYACSCKAPELDPIELAALMLVVVMVGLTVWSRFDERFWCPTTADSPVKNGGTVDLEAREEK